MLYFVCLLQLVILLYLFRQTQLLHPNIHGNSQQVYDFCGTTVLAFEDFFFLILERKLTIVYMLAKKMTQNVLLCFFQASIRRAAVVSVLVNLAMAFLAAIFSLIPNFPYIALLFFYTIGIVSFVSRSLIFYYYSKFVFESTEKIVSMVAVRRFGISFSVLIQKEL